MMNLEQYDEVIVRDSTEIKEETYSCEQFIEEIKNLSDMSIVYTCHFSDYQLQQIYHTTIENFNMTAMSLTTIREFIDNLRNKNKEDLQIEVEYYKKEITGLLKRSIETVSKKEFWKIIGNRPDKDKDGLLSEIFIQKSRNTSYISCVKLLTILEEVTNEIEDNISPNLSFQKLLSKRISDKEVEIHGDMNSIISAFQAQQNTQLQKYFTLWHRKMNYVYEFVSDEEVRFQIQTFLEDVTQVESQLLEEIKDIFQKTEELRSTCMEFDEVNGRLTNQIQLYEQALQQRKNQIFELTQQLKELQKDHKEVQYENIHLNGVMGQGRTNLVELSKQCIIFQEELSDYKQRYNEIYNEYERMLEQKTNQQKIVKKQEQGKIFTERTIKQQLDDTLHKFNKLLKERNSERKVFEEKEEKRVNQIQFLEGKVEELQNQIKNKTQQLHTYITNSRIMEFRSSILRNSRLSIKTGQMGSGIFDIRPSKLLRSTIKKRESKIQDPLSQGILLRPSQKTVSRVSVQVLGEPQEDKDLKFLRKSSSKSKLKHIDIAAEILPQIEEEDDISHIVDASILPPQQNITNIISKDTILQDMGGTWLKQSEKKEVEESFKQSILKDKFQQPKNEYFMSKGVLINIYGVKNETTFLMTRKRFCYFDTKLRLSKYLPIENIKCFVFCRTNTTLFIIRPKNVMELSREHITHPLIISTRNRGAFASFLTNKIAKTIRQNQIQLLTRYEDDIFLKIDGNQVNMKHKIPNMKNPFRLGISHAPVFFVKLQEEGLFNRKHNAVMIVQPIGLICFQGSEISQIEAGRQFLFLMPLEECCRIIEKEDSKQAPGRKVRIVYQTDLMESYYSLIFNSKEDVKLFIKACDEQKKSTQNIRTSIYKSLDQMFKKGSIN